MLDIADVDYCRIASDRALDVLIGQSRTDVL
jgi:hypothetical protein